MDSVSHGKMASNKQQIVKYTLRKELMDYQMQQTLLLLKSQDWVNLMRSVQQ